MNIIVSGWPGVGQSTLSLILAKNLNYKLLQGSSTFRFIWKGLNLNNNAEDRVKADELVQNYWGNIYEKYIDYILENEDKFILESDISGFRNNNHSKNFSIFLKANNNARNKRLISDNRSEEINLIKARDELLRKQYKDFFNVDFFHTNKIDSTHSFVIDSSELSIAEELKTVYKKLTEINIINSDENLILSENSLKEEKNYWTNGKEWYKSYLESKDLLPSAELIIGHIKRLFKEDIQTLPSIIKKIIE